MQVSHDEGVGIHIGPESCAVAREDFGEALTGGCIGQPLSRKESYSGCRRRCVTFGVNYGSHTDARLTWSPASGNFERFSGHWKVGSPTAEGFCNTIPRAAEIRPEVAGGPLSWLDSPL